MEEPPVSILIFAEDDVLRSLVARALMRRFPGALLQQCGDGATARFASRQRGLTTIVAAPGRHSGTGETLQGLRECNATVPIILLSADMSRGEALACGASHVIDPQNWIRIPDMVGTITRLALRHEPDGETEFLASA